MFIKILFSSSKWIHFICHATVSR